MDQELERPISGFSNKRRTSKGKQTEKKYVLVGVDKEEAEKEQHGTFLDKIKDVLKEALDGLLSAAEVGHRTLLRLTFSLSRSFVAASVDFGEGMR